MADREYFGFVWDENKNALNKQKHHGLDFETAVRIFNDPCLYSEYDEEHSLSSGEYREKNLGLLNGAVVLAVWTTDRNGKKRVVTARNATPKEIQIYERHRRFFQAY